MDYYFEILGEEETRFLYLKLSDYYVKPNWFSESDASTFANAEASFKIKIRKPLRPKHK